VLVTHNENILTAEQHFGAQVKEAREVSGWTQEALARHLQQASGIGLSQTAITRLEQGKRPIRLNEASALAKLFGLDLQALSGTLTQLTDDEYQQAKAELENVVQKERAVAEKSSQLQEHLATEVAELMRERRHLIELRWRYKAMVDEYEARGNG
jgi:transcriptional regulator with XRE-family HTH domain